MNVIDNINKMNFNVQNTFTYPGGRPKEDNGCRVFNTFAGFGRQTVSSFVAGNHKTVQN